MKTALLAGAIALALLLPTWAPAQNIDDLIVDARAALRKNDRSRLAALRIGANAAAHPLAQWVEYWELGNRLPEAQQSELDAFNARWPATYVEDRLRNDWLLELGRRRDWPNFRVEFPRFRMNDDREVTCYALLTQHLAGQDVRNAARSAWIAQRDLDDGCALLARTLAEARVFTPDDLWQAARLAVENNRPRTARAAATLISPATGVAVGELLDNPARFLAGKPSLGTGANGANSELTLLALMRMAASDPESAAGQLDSAWAQRLPLPLTATAWAHIGKQAALKQLPQAAGYAGRAWQLWHAAARPGAPPWSDELLAWQVRAALRLPDGEKQRWPLVVHAVDAMSAAEQRDSSWVYWRARAAQALSRPDAQGDATRATAHAALQVIASQPGFYGLLATEDLGLRMKLPAPPALLTAGERDAIRNHPGLTRALQLISLGLRHEGVREWNFSLRGMQERELLAAAQWACEREVYDRCISTSERTRTEIDMALRYPTPYREQLQARARAAGLDSAVLYGLIRQESRFMPDLRSAVGASGLMQLMPATARWTAKQVGLDYRPEMLTDRDVNLQLGAAYFRRVLDDFGGSLALATAAYNAGPGRPRRWREGGAVMEPAAWAESIPYTETRDYVKKVLANSVYYAALLQAGPDAAAAPPLPLPTLKARLGSPIGPRGPGATSPDRDLP